MKKSLYVLSVVLFSFGLAACANEQDLTEEWQERAQETGIVLQSNDGFFLMFGSEGMRGTDPLADVFPKELPFPFEKDKVYSDYQITREGDELTIQAGDDLRYELTIRGKRLFYDAENKVDYQTDLYLFENRETSSSRTD